MTNHAPGQPDLAMAARGTITRNDMENTDMENTQVGSLVLPNQIAMAARSTTRTVTWQMPAFASFMPRSSLVLKNSESLVL
jgi:hypothetical protein